MDQADPDATSISGILDSIPRAWERAQEGLAATREGQFVPLDELSRRLAAIVVAQPARRDLADLVRVLHKPPSTRGTCAASRTYASPWW